MRVKEIIHFYNRLKVLCFEHVKLGTCLNDTHISTQKFKIQKAFFQMEEECDFREKVPGEFLRVMELFHNLIVVVATRIQKCVKIHITEHKMNEKTHFTTWFFNYCFAREVNYTLLVIIFLKTGSTRVWFCIHSLQGDKQYLLCVGEKEEGAGRKRMFYAKQYCTVLKLGPLVYVAPDLICNFLSHIP